MKPTPPGRLHRAAIALVVLGVAGLLRGCGHTREILHPGRKLSPPRAQKDKTARAVPAPAGPLADDRAATVVAPPRADIPTTIDVPLIDRNGP